MNIKAWLKKRKRIKAAVKTARMGMGGHPVEVIQGIPTRGKSPRNLARIATCKRVLEEIRGQKGSDLYISWEEELKRRIIRREAK